MFGLDSNKTSINLPCLKSAQFLYIKQMVKIETTGLGKVKYPE